MFYWVVTQNEQDFSAPSPSDHGFPGNPGTVSPEKMNKIAWVDAYVFDTALPVAANSEGHRVAQPDSTLVISSPRGRAD